MRRRILTLTFEERIQTSEGRIQSFGGGIQTL